MRRFISYLALSLGTLVVCGATFSTVVSSAKGNYEFYDGRSLVYRLNTDESGELSSNAADDVISIMEQRLKLSNVDSYSFVKEGNDIIKVTFEENNDDSYENVKNYLSFNGKFAIGTSTNVMAVGDEFLTSYEARLEHINNYPTVVLPINAESQTFKTVLEEAKKIYDETEPQEEGGEKAPCYIYLIGNYKEGDQISEIVEGSSDYDPIKTKNLVMMFTYDSERLFFNDDKTEICSSLNIDSDGDGSYSSHDVAVATDKGKHYVNMINACEMPYEVEFLYQQNAPAYIENFFYLGVNKTINMSKTLVSILVGLVFVCLILALFYRFAAFSIVITSISSSYLALMLSLIFNVELSLATIVGIILVGLTSVACGIIHVHKIKEECYRGRSLKKANIEGTKKSLLPILDVNVVLIIVGVCCFLFGGSSLVPFASITVLGGIISFILNVLFGRGLLWLLTNTTKFVGKYKVIGVDEKKVPDILKEEKQTFFGTYQDKDITTKKKPIGIIMAVLGLASIVGISLFSGMNQGISFVNNDNGREKSYLYFETSSNQTDSNPYYDVTRVKDIFGKTKVSFNGTDYVDLETISVMSYDKIEKEKDEADNIVEIKYFYVVATLENRYVSSLQTKITIDETHIIEGTLSEVFSNYLSLEDADSKASSTFKEASFAGKSTPLTYMVVIGSLVALGVSCLYLGIRYGLTRGLSGFAIGLISFVIPVGFLSLTRMPTLATAVYGAPFVLTFALLGCILFFNKDKEMAKDDFIRTKDNSVSKREEIMIKSSAITLSPFAVVGVLFAYLSLACFGFGPSILSSIYISMLLGILLTSVFIPTCLMPLAHFLFASISKKGISLKLPKRNKKRKAVNKSRSAEPEEAVFIGIND